VIIAVIIGAGLDHPFLDVRRLGSGRESAGRPNTPVRVITPEASSHTVVLTVTGTVTATALVDLSPQVGGRIVEISPNARTGAAFEAGEVLFQIDPRDYRVAVTRARSRAGRRRSSPAANRSRRRDRAPGMGRSLSGPGDHVRSPPASPSSPPPGPGSWPRKPTWRRPSSIWSEQKSASRSRAVSPTAASRPGCFLSAGQRYGAVYDLSTLEIVAPIAPADLVRLGDVHAGRRSSVFGRRSSRSIRHHRPRRGPAGSAHALYRSLSGPGDAAPACARASLREIEIERPGR
jgi:hypothetical protein